MLTTQQVRDKFTSYFESKGHEKLESSPLIPQNDPTLLFANAGMNQFKDYFVGKAIPENKRAVTIQKVVRAGGKHNDLDNVGFTARHHTFFEMLGNFSFGDYFKEEAIKMAWNFLTVELKIPKDKLYVTVHDSDEEARKIWNEQEGVPLDRIFYMGDKDNFWEMGDTGPCGPCSEIFYDHGEEFSDGADTSSCILHDEGRYVEVWNLVFMQYEKFKDENGKVTRQNLPKPSVDTGAGLERLTACLQGVYWNYDIDGFNSIKSEIENLSGKKYTDPKAVSSIRIVSDHIRAATMLITDGVMPSNEGRGYVLRRIIRRAVRHLNELGLSEISFYKLVPSVFADLGKEYPQNKANSELAIKLLTLEEEKFRQTLKTGLDLLNKEIKKLKPGTSLSGKIAFKLYDTFGFPLDLTQVILEEQNFKLDTAGFEDSMKKQKENSKATSKFELKEDNLKDFYQIKEKHGDTKFLGYHNLKSKSSLVAIEKQDDYIALVFDSTPFYAESGGQVGDIGTILDGNGNVLATVIDTQKPVDGLFVHYCSEADLTALTVNEEYELAVNKGNRDLIMRNHSATHLLQSALIEVLGKHVKQAGSRVSSDSLRFDFTHSEALKKDEIAKVEMLVNQKIGESLSVQSNIMTKDEATSRGAMALFGEKYGDSVRVLEMGNFSIELCGGTHVENTKDIGLFTITIETSLSSGVRRIEALTSTQAFTHLSTRSSTLSKIERMFSVNSEMLNEKLENLQQDLKNKNKEIQKLKDQMQAHAAKDMFSDIKKLDNGIGIVCANLKEGSPKDFRNISDKFIDQDKDNVLFLYLIADGKISYLLRTDKKNKNINCSSILKSTQECVSGRGGGKPDMGQGSGNSEDATLFIEKITTELKGL
jgi:alanyl-tRNA synthetase